MSTTGAASGRGVRVAQMADIPSLASMLGESFPELSFWALDNEPERSQAFWEGVLQRTWECGEWLVVEGRASNPIGMSWLTSLGEANPLASRDVCRKLAGLLRWRYVCWKLKQLNAPVLEPGEAYLDWMTIRPALRGRGSGRLLLEGVAHHAIVQGSEMLMLDVETNNTSAIRLYHGFGFREKSTRWKPTLTLLYGTGQLTRMELELT